MTGPELGGVIFGTLGTLVAAITLLRAYIATTKSEAVDIGALETRVDALEKRAENVDMVIADLMGRVELLPAMNEKLTGLDRLVSTRLDQVDRTLGRVAERLDRMAEGPAFRRPDA